MIEYIHVEIEMHGAVYRGLGCIEDGLLTVGSPRFGEKSAVLHSIPVQQHGRLLLSELVSEG